MTDPGWHTRRQATPIDSIKRRNDPSDPHPTALEVDREEHEVPYEATPVAGPAALENIPHSPRRNRNAQEMLYHGFDGAGGGRLGACNILNTMIALCGPESLAIGA